ncbi:hypothetical protein [Flavobacterium lipolyticum]|uniref:Uncharacterized protein n=1 Tax=Flavobacterium lipolyticum TaxID=2893754 RepID=A0ABS8M4V8_9FLAO|nr:hypothetical protein [Flavobacterium sp. F-126]MCC9019221.1 hypothetical protein [Flavobacterium sp. F-126]
MKFKIIFLVVLISNISRAQIRITSALAPTITNAGLGNLYRASDTNRLYIGLSNGTLFLLGRENGSWNLNGNSNPAATSLLGTTTDTKVTLASNNTSILELGKRSTLGLTLTKPDYNNADQYMAYLRGRGGVSALEFEKSTSVLYESRFYTNSDGNLRWRGTNGVNDFFEIGTGGYNDNGSLDIITGDAGVEPIVFKKNSVADGTIEMMRVQGRPLQKENYDRNVWPRDVRVGIFTGGAVANSVLQVGGSFSLPIRAVTASTTLTDTDYTVVLKSGTYSGTEVTLPPASSCRGRIYVIRNISGADRNISAYISRTGVSRTTLANNRIYSFQSDATDWQLTSDDY